MKKNMVAASAALALTVGLSACGSHTSAPEAQGPLPDVFPVEQGCTDIPKPSDPHGLIGDNWLKDNPCAIFNMNRPGAGVDSEQGVRIVYDARMKALAGKRDLALLARQGTEQADNPNGVTTDFKGAIAQRRASLKAEINASGLALQGKAPEGFRISYLKGEGR
ncbi:MULTISPECIES: hypothetical protein [Mycobacteroides]|uniref:Lipoprotein n=2 Tax=Mycobacteroides immunogenum TaxID=83262 RepID=A0A7V8RWZ0_9MYCO|nr:MULTISPECIES: hypothetical protein [Mycobacteroides]AMT69290.1 hypothetical protein ABG82_01920 [Mycobacteroides immunogenum]ANO02326.1 hypothetical protein BAB75_01910 [Mycobacteroides immunogenum]KIU37520.1 hypothetical protein TL11_27285 [Mycobacteroides immunogenum]KPG02615.1 hypothetical protein AN910_27225 [Mycobacteroides immunogenum]KPG08442.1 hypothetical protein AN909_14000 [Mycobacteroides immunogenum]